MILLAPIFSAVICGILAVTGRAQKIAPAFTLLATALSAAIAFAPQAFPSNSVFGDAGIAGAPHNDFEWLSLGAFRIILSVHLDHLALLMVAVVCVVSFLVQWYSIGYMAG